NPDYQSKGRIFGDATKAVIETTPGRVRFNEIWPPEMGYFNNTVGKKQLSDIIWRCFQASGHVETVAALDRLKTLGFREAMRSGCSIGITDMVIPESKVERLGQARREVDVVEKQCKRGVITEGEKYQ